MKNDIRPTASIKNLKGRAEMTSRIRAFFESRDFFHVETPILSQDMVVDRYIEPIHVETERVLTNQTIKATRYWLQTSPEFSMKRLLASGAEAIYQITKAFRAGELGHHHNPEFTMLEWYRVGDSMREAMDLLSEFAVEILERPPAEQLTYQAAFERHAGINPHTDSLDDFERVIRQTGTEIDSGSLDRDGWLNLILSAVVEPRLGIEQPSIVYDWPATQSALAIVRNEEPKVAERFELYVDGVELANGYHELLDADELLSRNRANNGLRVADGSSPLPEESMLLEAMRSGLPDCCGVALGVDRLAMLYLGVDSIQDVIPFPFDRA